MADPTALKRWLFDVGSAPLEPTYDDFHRMLDERAGVRRHSKIFVNQTLAGSIDFDFNADDKMLIVGALSDG